MRQLARWLPSGVEAPRQDVAERLGAWLNVAEAIQLHSAQGALHTVGAAAARRPSAAAALGALQAPLQGELQRVRGVLTQSITARDAAHPPDPNALDLEFALMQQRLNEQQRRMEMSVDALRGHVRQKMAQTTPALAQLASLDASMAPMLAGREQRLLAQLPTFLKARFQSLRQAAAASDTPDDLRWLQGFAAEFEQLLLAELDLRLQPVTGLIEALEE